MIQVLFGGAQCKKRSTPPLQKNKRSLGWAALGTSSAGYLFPCPCVSFLVLLDKGHYASSWFYPDVAEMDMKGKSPGWLLGSYIPANWGGKLTFQLALAPVL